VAGSPSVPVIPAPVPAPAAAQSIPSPDHMWADKSLWLSRDVPRTFLWLALVLATPLYEAIPGS
jgi:hypothetical protein